VRLPSQSQDIAARNWYQIMLLAEKGTCVCEQVTSQRLSHYTITPRGNEKRNWHRTEKEMAMTGGAFMSSGVRAGAAMRLIITCLLNNSTPWFPSCARSSLLLLELQLLSLWCRCDILLNPLIDIASYRADAPSPPPFHFCFLCFPSAKQFPIYTHAYPATTLQLTRPVSP